MTTVSLGDNGFRWFIGVVEDIEDPLKLGRVRVRILNIHNKSKSLVPTEQLPWAMILNTPTSASYKKIGIAPLGLDKDSTVVGFFLDGRECNQPVIMGTMLGTALDDVTKNDIPPEAREVNEIKKELIGEEPESAFGAKYPHNKVIRTKAGHVIELDDTPDHERIHMFHKSGTYFEIDNEGRHVLKVVGDGYEIVAKDKTLWVSGSVNVTIGGDANINVDGSTSVQSAGKISLFSSDDVSIESSKNVSITAGGTVALNAVAGITADSTSVNISMNESSGININSVMPVRMSGSMTTIDSTISTVVSSSGSVSSQSGTSTAITSSGPVTVNGSTINLN